MDAIDTFLDAMFAPYPSTPRLAEAKSELRQMMEDAYADAVASGATHNEAVGKVITDFGNLDELAPVLGIEGDLAPAGGPADRAVSGDSAGADDPTGSAATMTLPKAQELADAARRTAPLLGWGTGLCVLGAAALIGIPSAAVGSGDAGLFALTEDEATAFALPLMLLLVAIGAGLLVHRYRSLSSHIDILGAIEGQGGGADPVVVAWAARLKASEASRESRALSIAVVLWILSAAPTVGLGALADAPGQRDLSGLGVAGTLVLAAAGLVVYLPARWATTVHDLLTDGAPAPSARPAARADVGSAARPSAEPGEGLADPAAPQSRAHRRVPIGTYWTILTVVYIAVGGLTQEWAKASLIWPLGALLVPALLQLTRRRDRA